MATPDATRKVRRTHQNGPPVRLVKSWLPAELVRRIDTVVLSSGGAYADRTDFLVEAINDRLAEEGGQGASVPTEAPVAARSTPAPVDGQSAHSDLEEVEFGDWLSPTTELPTLPAAQGPAYNFGLHNRDLPTLWAFDWLARLVAREGAPLVWEEFQQELLPRAWAMGRILRQDDVAGILPVKVAAGFPTNAKKRDATERRFMAHSVGAIRRDDNAGPLFVFRMIGLERGADGIRVAPASEGLDLFGRLVEAGIAASPPFAPAAWRAFASHIRRHSPVELETWLRVLRILDRQPTRQELVAACDWWSGAPAETNAMSYVARGREWGLVEPKLINGRYRLTAIGQAEVASPRNDARQEGE